MMMAPSWIIGSPATLRIPVNSGHSLALAHPICCVALHKMHRTKVLFSVVGTDSKIILDYVIRRLDALSAGLTNWLKA